MEKVQSNILDFQFIYDSLLVEPVQTNVVSNGLVNPNQYDDKPEYGIVRKVGTGRLMDNGELVPLHVKVGDVILFNKYSPSTIRHEGKDYLVIREYDVVATLHE